MAYCPVSGRTDADRNFISNIHARGNHVEDVADRIADLALRIVTLKRSGTTLKEQAA
jgi:ethanolamine ammonia-lyase small subunit